MAVLGYPILFDSFEANCQVVGVSLGNGSLYWQLLFSNVLPPTDGEADIVVVVKNSFGQATCMHPTGLMAPN
jgi:hypothetical protein